MNCQSVDVFEPEEFKTKYYILYKAEICLNF
jgi:hypothetical protein